MTLLIAPAVIPLIAAGISLGGMIYGGISARKRDKKNREAQEKQNELDRQFQREMYERSTNDSRQDWANQNAYNDPLQQMTRLRQAGLNPNLIYGKGADNTAASIRGGQASGGNQTAPKSEGLEIPYFSGALQNALSQYQQAKFMTAQTDNLQTNIQLQQANENKAKAETIKTLAETDSTKFQLQQQKELKDSVLEKAKLENHQMKLQHQNTIASTNNIRTKTLETELNMELAKNEDLRRAVKNKADVAYTYKAALTQEMQKKLYELQIENNPVQVEKMNAEIQLLIKKINQVEGLNDSDLDGAGIITDLLKLFK